MAQGSRTARKKELQFRAKLLELGVVRRAAIAVGIPVNTGYEIARRAEEDTDFVQAREAMRARVVPEVEAKLLALAEDVAKRVKAKDLTPAELARIAVRNNLKSFSYQNPKPQYFRGLVDLYGKLVGARKTGEVVLPPGSESREVVIRISPVAKPDGKAAGG